MAVDYHYLPIIRIAIGLPVELILVVSRWLLAAPKLIYCLMDHFKLADQQASLKDLTN
jgi:hypothetical protein